MSGRETDWDRDPRFKGWLVRATTFRLALDGDRELYLKLRNTFDWWRWMIRSMDFYLSAAESAFSYLEPNRLSDVLKRQSEKKVLVAEKRIASGKSTPEKEREKAEKAAKNQPSAAEVGFRICVYNAAAKVAESARQGVKNDAAVDTLYYEMRTMFFVENKKAVDAGLCLPMASYLWDAARIELASMRDKELPGYGNAKRSWLVNRGVLGNIEAQNAAIYFSRTHADHCREFGNEKGVIPRTRTDPIVKFCEDGKEQYVLLKFSKDPEVQLKFIVAGKATNNDGTTWDKNPPASVRSMFHRMATGVFPVSACFLNKDKKGRLGLLATFRRPVKSGVELDQRGKLEVVFSSMMGSELPLPTGKKQEDALNEMERVKDMRYVIHALHQAKTGRWYVERIAVNAVLDRLQTFEKRKLALEFSRDSQRYFPKKHKVRLDKSIRGYTLQRVALQRSANHDWTKSLIHKAIKWQCGSIVVYNLPKSGGLLLGEAYPWRWSDFGRELESKSKYFGIKLELREDPDLKPLYKLVRETFRGTGEPEEKQEEKPKEAKGGTDKGSICAA